MTTPTGQISMLDVLAELGFGQQQVTLADELVRQLAGVPSGQIDMHALRGKTRPTTPGPGPAPGPTPPPPPAQLMYEINAGQAYGNVVSENSQEEYRGYSQQLQIGSINTGAFFSGTQVTDLYTHTSPINGPMVYLVTTGAHPKNVFSTLNISGTIFGSADAQHVIPGNNTTIWQWFVGYNWAVGTTTVVAITGG